MSYDMVIYGNPGDGFGVLGPFRDGNDVDENEINDEWWALPMQHPRDRWGSDLIQFGRLIAELEAVGAFTAEVINALMVSMDVTSDQVAELMDRAQAAWDEMKEGM